jgi:hypothetical protein
MIWLRSARSDVTVGLWKTNKQILLRFRGLPKVICAARSEPQALKRGPIFNDLAVRVEVVSSRTGLEMSFLRSSEAMPFAKACLMKIFFLCGVYCGMDSTYANRSNRAG